MPNSKTFIISIHAIPAITKITIEYLTTISWGMVLHLNQAWCKQCYESSSAEDFKKYNMGTILKYIVVLKKVTKVMYIRFFIYALIFHYVCMSIKGVINAITLI